MSKLSIEDFSNTTDALKSFKRECSTDNNKIEAYVIVKDSEDNVLFSFEDVDIIFGSNANYDTVDLMWEPFLGNNYKTNGLYGRYSTTYNKMLHNYKELTIFSDDRKIIIQI